MTLYQRPRWGAIGLGCLCAVGAGASLVHNALETGWTLDHGLSLLALALSIFAGHMAWHEFLAVRPMRAAGLAVVFTGLVFYIVASTAGRTIEAQKQAAAEAIVKGEARTAKLAELVEARKRKGFADIQADREMTGQRCLERCKDWRTRSGEVASHIHILEAQLARLTPAQANAKLVGMAQLICLFGCDVEALTAKFVIAWPFVLPLVFEFGSIVFFGIGFPRRRPDGSSGAGRTVRAENPDRPSVRPDRPDRPATRAPAAPAPVKPTTSPPDGRTDDPRKDKVLAAIVTDLALRKTFGSQKELCERFAVKRSTMSDWLREWERDGLIPERRTDGRTKTLVSGG